MKDMIHRILRKSNLAKNTTFTLLVNLVFAYLALAAVITTTLDTPPSDESLEPYRQILYIFEGEQP